MTDEQRETSPSVPPAGERSRAWFVLLAWITLILFGLFVLGITLGVAAIPRIREGRVGPRGADEVR